MIKRRFLFFQRRTFVVDHILEKLSNSLVFLIILSSLTSCVSAKYKMAGEDTKPPVPLNISAEAHSVNALINTVIIFGGPGSWKRDAYWDEYMMSITNNGEHPVTLTSATLIDFQGNPVISWDKPWELQEQSKTWIKNYDSGKTGVVLKVGAASVMTGAVFGGLALIEGGSAFVSGAAVASAAAPVAALVALPIIGIGSIFANADAKKKIESEFHRRCLALPITIQPGQETQGSLFFRITPGPQRLSLLFTGVDPGFDVSVDLKPLSDLHMDTKPGGKMGDVP